MAPTGSRLAFIVKSNYVKAANPANFGRPHFIRATLAAKLTGAGGIIRRAVARRFGCDSYVEFSTVNGFIVGKTTAEVPQ
jgi:hypothetical protein